MRAPFINHNRSFAELVQARRFKLLTKIVESDQDGTNVPKLALHSVLAKRPPASFVTTLLGTLGISSLFQTDLLGRTPLHIAILHGCPLEIVQLLLAAIERTDAYGRTALHLAAAAASQPLLLSTFAKSWSCAIATTDKDILELTSLLYHTYPQAASIQDEQGRCPWQVAVAPTVQAFLRQQQQHFIAHPSPSKKKEHSHHDHTHPTDDDDESTFYSSFCLPHEIDCHDDDDDVSTVGTGGVSRVGRRSSSRRPYQRFEL